MRFAEFCVRRPAFTTVLIMSLVVTGLFSFRDLSVDLLPTLLASPGSHVVNLSSLFGLISPAGQSAYSASKFAIRGFSQALRAELLPRGVGVTTVHPGGIKTRIAETARVAAMVTPRHAEAGKRAAARLLTYPAEQAAADILRAVERRKARLVITRLALVLDVLARVLPVGHARLISPFGDRGPRRRPAA